MLQSSTTPEDRKFDVVAVCLKSNRVSLVSERLTEKNAEAVVSMAVLRRGNDDQFYASVPTGLYLEGDAWDGAE